MKQYNTIVVVVGAGDHGSVIHSKFHDVGVLAVDSIQSRKQLESPFSSEAIPIVRMDEYAKPVQILRERMNPWKEIKRSRQSLRNTQKRI